MIDLGDECMYEPPPIGGMGYASTLHGHDEETDADRRVRELRQSILGDEPSAEPRRIGLL